jgi:hypothetical protein
VEQQRESNYVAPHALGHEEDGPEAVLHRVAELLGELVDVLSGDHGKLGAQYRLHLLDGVLVGRGDVVVDPPDSEHRFIRSSH